MPTVTLHPSASQPYDIVIGAGALEELPERIAGSYDSVTILHDDALEDIAEKVQRYVGAATLVAVPSGEASKSLQEVENIANSLLAAGATRQSLLVNVGGGMLTDLGGFVASIYMRGIPFIHIPTSLLAMADASIGGKTGVDVGSTKNILGSFAHPIAVYCDIDLLETLPDEGMREGLVEVIKMAAMLDREIFSWLESNAETILKRQPEALAQCIGHAVTMKAKVVEEDEREKDGKRMLLNFGHTVGHALEAASRFSLSHGRAVSIGMVEEMRLAQSKDRGRVTSLLRAIAMPTEMPTAFARGNLWTIMENDKKVRSGKVRIVVPSTLGQGATLPIEREHFLRFP